MGKKFKKVIKSILEGIIEIIYPTEYKCIVCNEDDCYGICDNCLSKINTIPIENQSDIISYGYYGGILKKLILDFKYKSNFTAGDVLSYLLSEYIINNINYKNYVLTYVPLSQKSRKKRGFNQCEYICRHIGRKLSIECVDIIVKCRETKEQKTLNKSERMLNLKDAFKIRSKINIENVNIMLIDDVTTTGATLRECCRILKKCGVNDIKLLTLAKSHI